VNEFVEACRREWRRLRVPPTVADEMAAELAADLAEADAEAVSAEEALGSDDPRSFAETWAVARGVARPRHARVGGSALAFAAVTITCALAAAGAALVLSVSSQARSVDCLPDRVALPGACASAPVTLVTMSTGTRGTAGTTWQVSAAAPSVRSAGPDRSLGFALLGGGLAGALLALAWLARGLREWSVPGSNR
jgi:hypothetical protein